jgi:hypothetical protein
MGRRIKKMMVHSTQWHDTQGLQEASYGFHPSLDDREEVAQKKFEVLKILLLLLK